MSKPLTVSFPLPKDSIRKLVFSDPAHVVYHVYPRLSHYRGKSIPDKNNPRPHDETVLTSSDSRKIWDTLERKPKLFKSRNRAPWWWPRPLATTTRRASSPLSSGTMNSAGSMTARSFVPCTALLMVARPMRRLPRSRKAKSDCQELHDAQFHLEVVVFADNEGEELAITS